MFSKTCEYAIKATLYVAHQSQLGKRVGLKDIADIGKERDFEICQRSDWRI
jgi:DNA-binding IscR family transcriptional regulator